MEGTPPNVLSLKNELQATGTLENVSIEFLYVIAQYAHTTAYVPAYCKVIKEKSNLRRIQLTAQKIAQDAAKGILPANEIISAATNELTAITGSNNETKIISLHDFIRDDFEADMKSKAVYSQRKSGFTNLDSKQIWTPGIFGIGGTPGTGKTSFCTQLLENLARNDKDCLCLYFSYEMSTAEIALKSIARQIYRDDPFTRIYSSNMHENYNKDDRRQSTANNIARILNARANIDKMNLKNFRVVELHDENVDQLLTMINRLCKGNKAPVAVVDYLQLVAQANGTENVKVAVDNAIRKLKIFSRDTGATFFVVSSLNRCNYTETAALEAFKESGAFDFGLDVAWIMQPFAINELSNKTISAKRERLAEAMKERPRKIQLKCLKNRRGALYDCFFNYYPQHDFFINPDEDVNNPHGRWYEKTSVDSKPAPRANSKPAAQFVDDAYAFEETDDDNEY